MNEELIINEYSKLGLTTQKGLYNFIMENDSCDVDGVHYNLRKSNECMEFMAKFLKALGFDVKRLYLESDKNKHWFLLFNSGLNWFYYEVILKDISGQYTFKNYDSLITFAVSKIIKSLEGLKSINEENISVFKNYILREISPLDGFDVENNISSSKKGNEILVWNNLNTADDYDRVIKKVEKDVSSSSGKINWVFFIIGFVFTLAVGCILIFTLAMHYSGKL
ncbi:MAG: hypothetical protein IKG40_03415 [Bacilli bacterium]|nr:hypothetical protein [Bacilli bacterium]